MLLYLFRLWPYKAERGIAFLTFPFLWTNVVFTQGTTWYF